MIDFGLTAGEFRERYAEREPYVQRLALRGAAFEWAELDAALQRVEPTAPIVQLFNGGALAEERYTDVVVELGAPRRRLAKRRFYAELRAGATLVVNGFEHYSPTALRLCAEVGRFYGAAVAGNAYLSIGGRGTFGRHWDTHDVFALQLIGRKRWQVFAPTFPLPLGMHRSEGSGSECPGTPVLDCVLESGDLLYVPRGWWHHVLPEEGASLHLSVGTYAPTVHDYVSWACARHLPAALAARRSLGAAAGAELDAAVEALRAAVLSAAARAEFEREAAGRERARTELHTELHLALGAAGLEPGDVVSINAAYRLDATAAEIAVRGGRLRLHPLARSILAALGDGSLTLEALCGKLGREQRGEIRAAVLDLVEHDVLTIVRAAR
ncbi:MAG TPA: cupin domain-containing protein [Gammaproteobacteria bacterium]